MSLRRLFRQTTGPVLDLVLPEDSWVRDGEERHEGEVAYGLSASVRERIAALSCQPFCYHCGLSIGPFETHDKKNPCGRCRQRELGVSHISRVGIFADPLIPLIHRLKFGRAWEIAGILAPLLYQSMLQVSEQARIPIDVVVPVPLHWSRRVKRGFNQAEELARSVSKLSGWKVALVLRRRRATREQARIETPTERQINLRGAFDCRSNAAKHISGRHVWLLDDVTTTGATLHAAASALRRVPKSHRPASINAAVVCVTDHQFPPVIQN